VKYFIRGKVDSSRAPGRQKGKKDRNKRLQGERQQEKKKKNVSEISVRQGRKGGIPEESGLKGKKKATGEPFVKSPVEARTPKDWGGERFFRKKSF